MVSFTRAFLALALAIALPACGRSSASPAPTFEMLFPSAGASAVALSPTFSWTPCPRAQTYLLQVSGDPAFGTVLVHRPGLSATTEAPAVVLAPGTAYYWRVYANTPRGTILATGAPALFTTLPLPGAFALQSPADGAVDVPLSPLLEWTPSTNAASYAIQVAADSGFTSLTLDVPAVSGTGFSPPAPLPRSTTHYWRVVARNASGSTTATSSPRSFTTLPPPPGAFSLVAPAEGEADVSRTPTFSWMASSDAVSYTLQVAAVADFSSLEVDLSGLAGTSHAPGTTLATSTAYFWRVLAVNAAGSTTAGGTPGTFTTVPPAPGAFTHSAPAEGATNVALTPVFSWTDAGGADSYTLQVSSSSVFSTLTYEAGGLLATSHGPIPALAASTTYHWRVFAVNPGGSTTAIDGPRSFTTLPPPPGAFSLTVPPDGGAGVPPKPAFSWTTSSHAASYTLEVSASADFSSLAMGVSGIAATAYTPAAPLATSTTYYWRVTAVNTAGSSTSAPNPGSFTTASQARMAISHATMSFSATAGGMNPAPLDLEITNPVGNSLPLRWSISSDQPWLQVSTGSGTTADETDTVAVIPVVAQTEAWTAETTLSGAPSGRENHSAVWTGSEMIIWGGTVGFGGGIVGDGRRYDPVADSWSADMSLAGAPSPRWGHVAVWTGSEMIVWGGRDDSQYFNTGYRYNPRTDTWSGPIAANPGFLARRSPSAVWTGTEMILWGGENGATPLQDGARYNPATDSWTPVSAAGPARWHHTAIWTGADMIVRGGWNGTNHVDTGARYALASDTWPDTISLSGTPPGLSGSTAVWNGSEMIVWGGLPAVGATTIEGARYDPATDAWLGATTLTGAPTGVRSHGAVWVGGEMIVWGGYDGGGFRNSGKRYRPPIALTPGTYVGTLTVTDPDADNSPQTITVTLTVHP